MENPYNSFYECSLRDALVMGKRGKQPPDTGTKPTGLAPAPSSRILATFNDLKAGSMTSATLPFAITVCGIEELAGHCTAGASHVLSILDPETPVPEAFGSFGEHRKLELRFDDLIDEMPGKRLPSPEDVAQILAFGRDLLAEPNATAHLLVHCHAGISRSTASMALLIAQALPEESAQNVVAMVHGIREKAWPNLRLIELGDAMLGRQGTLIAATHAHYRLQLERRPHIAEYMEQGGRGREIAAARLA